MNCKCTMSQSLAGDGCDVCNPSQGLEYAKGTISDLEETIEQQAERIERLDAVKDALVTLVHLKEHKDTQGKNDYYFHYQPIAWDAAREALAALDKENNDG